jgi:hypothetical protein
MQFSIAWLVSFLWIGRSPKIRELSIAAGLLAVILSGLILGGLGFAIVSHTIRSQLEISPSQVKFDPANPNRNFLFSVRNNSDSDLYAVEAKLKIETRIIVLQRLRFASSAFEHSADH